MMSFGSLPVWFLAAALCYVVVLLAFVGVRAVKDRGEAPEFSDIEFWLRCLLKNGYDGESVIFRDTAKSRFIRFEKYTDPEGSPGIELTFPEIGWGEEHLTKLRDLAASKGLAFRGSDGAGPAYAHIPFGGDLDEAFAFCRAIWTEQFGLNEQSEYLRQTGDQSTIEELLGTIDQPSEAERKARYLRHLNARLKHAGLAWLQDTSLHSLTMMIGVVVPLGGLGFLATLVCLPVAALLGLDDTPDWQLEFGGIGLRGSSEGLILFSLYVLAGAFMSRFMRIALIGSRPKDRIERALLAPRRIVFLLIPVAVVLVWLRV